MRKNTLAPHHSRKSKKRANARRRLKDEFSFASRPFTPKPIDPGALATAFLAAIFSRRAK